MVDRTVVIVNWVYKPSFSLQAPSRIKHWNHGAETISEKLQTRSFGFEPGFSKDMG